jgi:beta-N-acetylhexosaminidase
MLGIPGPTATPEIILLFKKTHAAGLIIFRPNFESAQKFRKLISDLENALGRRLLIAVDHEGGRVIHLAEGVTVFPDNWTLGNTHKEEYAAEQGRIEALELRRLGIDLNLAPTVDVLRENYSPNIGIRSYGKDAELVSRLGAARIKAMQEGGLSACAKHFPGQGHSPLDAHLDLPVLSASWDEMEKVHLRPFEEAIYAGVDAIMTSHPIYPDLDSKKVPATFSFPIVHELLREKLKFEGLILSDDLEMGALKGICSIGESACRAIEAGHDMVLICHDQKAGEEAHEKLLEAYETGRLNKIELQKTGDRIAKIQSRRPERFLSGVAQAEKEGNLLAAQIAREGIRIVGKRPEYQDVAVVFPRLSLLSNLIYIEEAMLDEKAFVKASFDKVGISTSQVETIGLHPNEDDFERIQKIVKKEIPVVFFCYDAHANEETRRILEFLNLRVEHTTVVCLRNPYDENLVSPKHTCIVTYGFRIVQIQAALGALNAVRQSV